MALGMIGTPGYGSAALRQRLMAVTVGFAVAVIVAQTAHAIVGIVYVGELVTPPENWQETYGPIFVAGLWLRNLAIVVGGAFYIAWQRRVTRNLLSLGVAELRPGLGLSTFSWIIPVANLIVPFLNARQVARGSAPPGERSAVALAGWWWLAWVAASFWTLASNLLYGAADDSGFWIVATSVLWIGNAMLATSGFLVILMSARITRQQETRIGQLRVAVEPAASGPAT
jgi:hypothetical protein